MSDSTPRFVVPFDYQSTKFRGMQNDDGSLWFVAKDACDVLGITWKGSGNIGPLDEDERGSEIVDTLGGPQEMATISESGLYTLIFRSNKSDAKKIRRWVTHEVLPALRKTGHYSVPGAKKLGGRDQNDLTRIMAAAKELGAVSKVFHASMKMARSMGFAGYRAVEKANEITLEKTGCDCIRMMGARALLEKEKMAGMMSVESGAAVLDEILKFMIPVRRTGGATVFLTMREVMSEEGVYESLKDRLALLGLKLVENGVFIHPGTVKKKILAREKMLDASGIRDCLRHIPGAVLKQLRLNGKQVRGVTVRWTEGGAV